MRDKGIRVSLFVDPVGEQIKAAALAEAQVVELHTGKYCGMQGDMATRELRKIEAAARHATDMGLECHAGHGLAFATVTAVAAIPQIVELNIGHFIIGEAIFSGMAGCIAKMRTLMNEARG